MNIVLFKNLNLLSIGNTVQISGMIWSGEGINYLCYLPDELNPEYDTVLMPLTLEEWNELVRQSDLMETEILAKDTEGKTDCPETMGPDGFSCDYALMVSIINILAERVTD